MPSCSSSATARHPLCRFFRDGYFDKALALISSGGFDLCMLSYGYVPRGYDQIWSARMTRLRDDCVDKAHELGMGIVAMKVIGGGELGAWSGYMVPGFDKQRLSNFLPPPFAMCCRTSAWMF